ncbi:MAG: hypothetical protein ACW99G_01325 [Candidatus Thorarchaeota archaeon]|jgi:hypothetical protein
MDLSAAYKEALESIGDYTNHGFGRDRRLGFLRDATEGIENIIGYMEANGIEQAAYTYGNGMTRSDSLEELKETLTWCKEREE